MDSPLPFSLDVKFYDSNGRYMSHSSAIANKSRVIDFKLRWRTQKNGTLGEERSCTRNRRYPNRDPVDAMLRIVERAIKLLKLPANLPLCVSQDSAR